MTGLGKGDSWQHARPIRGTGFKHGNGTIGRGCTKLLTDTESAFRLSKGPLVDHLSGTDARGCGLCDMERWELSTEIARLC